MTTLAVPLRLGVHTDVERVVRLHLDGSHPGRFLNRDLRRIARKYGVSFREVQQIASPLVREEKVKRKKQRSRFWYISWIWRWW